MPSSLADWVGVIAAAAMIFFGGGGIGAFIKQRHDSKNGVRQENRADVDSLNSRTVAILESQFNYLVKPLQDSVAGLRDDVTRLDQQVKMHRALYLSAIEHIRTLYAWIARHIPSDISETTDVPKPPSELVEDLNLRE